MPWYGKYCGIFYFAGVHMSDDSETMELLSVEEAATYLKFSTTYLYKLCREKKIPHVNYGRHIIFRKRDLYEWIGDMVVYSPSEDE